jgi:hypothetical protein
MIQGVSRQDRGLRGTARQPKVNSAYRLQRLALAPSFSIVTV